MKSHTYGYIKRPNKLPCLVIIVLALILSLFLYEEAHNQVDNYYETKNAGIVNQLSCHEATVYSYSSTVDQTDNDPFTMASGERVRVGAVANNCLPFHTKVWIEGKEYEVLDRMNARYTKCGENEIWYFDVWSPDKQTAINWGKKSLIVCQEYT